MTCSLSNKTTIPKRSIEAITVTWWNELLILTTLRWLYYYSNEDFKSLNCIFLFPFVTLHTTMIFTKWLLHTIYLYLIIANHLWPWRDFVILNRDDIRYNLRNFCCISISSKVHKMFTIFVTINKKCKKWSQYQLSDVR